MRRLAIAILILGLPFAAGAQPSGDDIATAIARELGERFKVACTAGDAEAVAGLYADDATAVFPGEGAVAHGREAIAALARDACRKDAGGELVMEAVRARFLGANAIVATGRWRQRAAGPDGKPVEAVVRTTEVLVRGADGWRYLSDHASVGVPAAAVPPASPGARPAR